MSQELINRNGDLKRLMDEGYAIEIKDKYILMHNVPYVNSNKEVKLGTLLCPLDLTGDTILKPSSHVMHFIGGYPYKHDGTPIEAIRHTSQQKDFGHGLVANHSFSSKPKSGGYANFYDKFAQYSGIISSEANAINPDVSSITHEYIESTEDLPFKYCDTNTGRATIGAISEKLENQNIGIIGLGGTGAYLLDFMAKTPVLTIHLFDGDEFNQHNAFRAPGAPEKSVLEKRMSKVEHLYSIYSNMKEGIIIHDEYVDDSNCDLLTGLDFVFVCIDAGDSKSTIIKRLIEYKIPFIDCGIGLNNIENSLSGAARITLVTPDKNDHVDVRISQQASNEDLYASNIQIAEINALNSIMAIIKWKQLYGFYRDDANCYHSVYEINMGECINEDKKV